MYKAFNKQEGLGIPAVAFLYVGTIMGAGFASGREIWQFFGVFGMRGTIGVVLAAALFVVLGMMTAYIARTMGTNDMGRVVVPGGNRRMISLVGYFMAGLLYTAIISMTAAGGSLLHQLFGLPEYLGGILITVMVIGTVLGEFQRVSKVFRYIMPVLFVTVVAVSLMVMRVPLKFTDLYQSVEPSPMASNWILAALLYISFNMLGMIAVVANASMNARSRSVALSGAAVGGIFLGILAFMLLSAVQVDMNYTQALDMPMLGYAGRISPLLTVIYGLILFFAIYSAATSNFYSFTTKIKEGPHKKLWVILSAAAGFFMGLIGFKNVVAFIFPSLGFLGLIIIGMLVVNFFRVWKDEHERNGFRFHDRRGYPACIRQVTGGYGGDVLLINGPEKTVIYDAGMCCFAEQTIANIEKELNQSGRTVNYIILSHSHYDHMGALPYFLKRWPQAEVCASEKTKKVFEREGARKTIEKMGKNAASIYGVDEEKVIVNPLTVRRVLRDGDLIHLGRDDKGQEWTIEAIETKGHTDCSMSYMVRPEKILLVSESCGVITGPDTIEVSALKSFDDTIASAEKLKSMEIHHLYSQHFGMVPDCFCYDFFDLYIRCACQQRDFIRELVKKGMSYEEILAEHEKKYWDGSRNLHQPYEAYRINAESEIRQEITNFVKCNSENTVGL